MCYALFVLTGFIGFSACFGECDARIALLIYQHDMFRTHITQLQAAKRAMARENKPVVYVGMMLLQFIFCPEAVQIICTLCNEGACYRTYCALCWQSFIVGTRRISLVLGYSQLHTLLVLNYA
jgi:hypothetical protein